MAWQTPVEDWAAPDCPIYSDFNRIEGNLAYLKGALDSMNDSITDHISGASPEERNAIHFTMTEVRGIDSIPLVLECRQSDPANPVVGQMWLRTDL